MVVGSHEQEVIVVATLPDGAQTTDSKDSTTDKSVGAVREVLETLRSHYQERLHRRSDDFAATQELRSVEKALAALTARDIT
jgi:hypothetical protein